MTEQDRRRRWQTEAHRLVRERAADPLHVAPWSELRGYFADGYGPSDAVDKYLQSVHLGYGA